MKLGLWVFLLCACVLLSHGQPRGNFGDFKRSLNNTHYGYGLIEDPTHKGPSSKVEVFEVRSGDCGFHETWNDCLTDRERSELTQVLKDTVAGDEYWYGWSIYFPKDFINLSPAKVSLGQFHQQASHPAWMFQHTREGYYLVNQLEQGRNHGFELIQESQLRGQWHQIEIQVLWQTSQLGQFNVWVNGQQKVNYVGPTMDAKQVYFKYGLYRAFLSRYLSQRKIAKASKISVPTQSVYFSNVKRGLVRKDLAPLMNMAN